MKDKKRHKLAKKIAEIFRKLGEENSKRLLLIKVVSLIPAGILFVVASFMPNALSIIAPWIFCLLASSIIMEAHNHYGTKVCDKIANKIEQKCKIKDQLDVYKENARSIIEDQKQEVIMAEVDALSSEYAIDESLINEYVYNASIEDRSKAKHMLRDMIKLYKSHKKAIKNGKLLTTEVDEMGEVVSSEDKIQQMLEEYKID